MADHVGASLCSRFATLLEETGRRDVLLNEMKLVDMICRETEETLDRLNILEQLLQKGLDVSTKFCAKEIQRYQRENSLTRESEQMQSVPIILAVKKNLPKVLERLLAYCDKEDMEVSEKCMTALLWAAMLGSTQCLEKLLQAGADVYAKVEVPWPVQVFRKQLVTDEGNNALHLAVMGNHEECVELLLKYGVDHNAINIKGLSSLYLAASMKLPKIVLAILNNACGVPVLSYPNPENNDTALHQCLSHGPEMEECVLALLRNHADTTVYSHLFQCCPRAMVVKQGCSQEMINLFFLNGTGVELDQPRATPPQELNECGLLNLYDAAMLGLPRIVMALLKSTTGVPFLETTNGDTLLHLCMHHEKRMKECIKMLIQRGADPLAFNKSGESVLHTAIRYRCSQDLFQLLVLQSKDLDLNKIVDARKKQNGDFLTLQNCERSISQNYFNIILNGSVSFYSQKHPMVLLMMLYFGRPETWCLNVCCSQKRDKMQMAKEEKHYIDTNYTLLATFLLQMGFLQKEEPHPHLEETLFRMLAHECLNNLRVRKESGDRELLRAIRNNLNGWYPQRTCKVTVARDLMVKLKEMNSKAMSTLLDCFTCLPSLETLFSKYAGVLMIPLVSPQKPLSQLKETVAALRDYEQRQQQLPSLMHRCRTTMRGNMGGRAREVLSWPDCPMKMKEYILLNYKPREDGASAAPGPGPRRA